MIWIPGEVPSKKNSKQVGADKEGDIHVSSSKFCLKYEKDKVNYGVAHWRDWHDMLGRKEWPITIQFHFVRRSKAEFDYNNISQVLLDLMQEWHWLPGDSMLYVIPDFSKGWSIDKKHPGVLIAIK